MKRSEDKKTKGAKSVTSYFLKGSKPTIIFDPKKNEALVRAKRGLFTTSSKKAIRVLTEKGYKRISAEQAEKLLGGG